MRVSVMYTAELALKCSLTVEFSIEPACFSSSYTSSESQNM